MNDMEIDIEFYRKMERVMGDEIEKLRREVAALKAAAEKGTEYVLAQINQDLRAERDAAVKAMSGWSGYGYRDGYYVDDIGEYFQPFIDAARGEK